MLEKARFLPLMLTLLCWFLISCGGSTTPEATGTPKEVSSAASPTTLPTTTPRSDPTQAPASAEPAVDEGAQTIRYEAPGDYLDSLIVDGLERWFVVHLPPQFEVGKSLPLVLNLHGRGSNTFQQRDASRMNEKADEEDFIVVYPQALGQPPTWFGVLFGETGQPDMNFFRELVVYLQNQLSIDPARIYATGISNGATMVNRLGCEMPDVFAAIAPVAGAHSGLHLCEIDRPISVLAIHGTDDPIIPYDGAEPDIPSVPFWVGAWAKRNGCQGDPESQRIYDNVIIESWEGCQNMTAVELYSVEDGGHTWLAIKSGSADTGFIPEVSATDVIWDFFENHPKQKTE